MAISSIKKLLNSKWTYLGGCKSTDLPEEGSYTLTLNQSMDNFLLILINTSYYPQGKPIYGGLTLSPNALSISEPSLVKNQYDISNPEGYIFSVYKITSTSLRVKFTGTKSNTACLSVHGIL